MKLKDHDIPRSAGGGIISIDPGERAGFAMLTFMPAFKSSPHFRSEAVNCGRRNSWAERVGEFYGALDVFCGAWPLEVMVIEKPIGHWAGADAAVSRYVGAALLLACQKHLTVIEVLPHVWKAALGPGMGRATPKQYRPACERVWGLPPGSFESEDEAAAAGIMWWAKNRMEVKEK